MFSILIFNLLKKHLPNPLLIVKDIVLNKVTCPTEAPSAVINDAIIILLLVTKKQLNLHKKLTHLPINLHNYLYKRLSNL